ncbi:hypothetical protein E2C01_008670 [Portunus trituberculatus]|uniref:Uncharacterized protein n=1 Tax=Portunus trituberculatus TaxID=210409 RepID=A0A5B7D4Z6_PORTR|nr:hypothetical protein [Portunus trituberculatus]
MLVAPRESPAVGEVKAGISFCYQINGTHEWLYTTFTGKFSGRFILPLNYFITPLERSLAWEGSAPRVLLRCGATCHLPPPLQRMKEWPR